MGYIIYTRDSSQKNAIYNCLHSKGLSSRPTPFRTRSESCRYVAIFKDHFYALHWQDVNAIMEGEEMLEININQFKKLMEE